MMLRAFPMVLWTAMMVVDAKAAIVLDQINAAPLDEPVPVVGRHIPNHAQMVRAGVSGRMRDCECMFDAKDPPRSRCTFCAS